MNNLKTEEIKKNPYFIIVFIRKIECGTIIVKLLKQHVISIKKMDKNVRIFVYFSAPTLLCSAPPLLCHDYYKKSV